MNNMYYIFAGFIILLTALASYIIIKAISDKKHEKKEKKELEQYNERERQLFSLYQNLEDMITSVEKYIEESILKVKTDRIESSNLLVKVEETLKKIQMEQNTKTEQKKNTVQNIKVEQGKQQPKKLDMEKLKNITFPTYQNKKVTVKPMGDLENYDVSLQSKNIKIDKHDIVKYLDEKGLDIEEISKKMGMSRGEVSLILGTKK